MEMSSETVTLWKVIKELENKSICQKFNSFEDEPQRHEILPLRNHLTTDCRAAGAGNKYDELGGWLANSGIEPPSSIFIIIRRSFSSISFFHVPPRRPWLLLWPFLGTIIWPSSSCPDYVHKDGDLVGTQIKKLFPLMFSISFMRK